MESTAEQLSSTLVEYCHEIGLEESYMAIPISYLSKEHITNYWQELYNSDQLKHRWADIKDPQVDEVVDLCLQMDPNYQTFAVIYCTDGYMVAEFTLENFTGRAAQVHFSMRQDLDYKTKIALADQVTDLVLNDWVNAEKPDTPYLETIFGLTPTVHRLACHFVLQAGFSKIGVLPKGLHYIDTISDAMITVKIRGH